MTAKYELLLRGNSLSFKGGFFGLCNVALGERTELTRGDPLFFKHVTEVREALRAGHGVGGGMEDR